MSDKTDGTESIPGAIIGYLSNGKAIRLQAGGDGTGDPPNDPPADPPADPPKPPDTDGTDWKAEAEKWKNFARKHEDAKKANKAEAERLQKEYDEYKASIEAEKESAQLSVAQERAVEKLHLKLARAGMDEETATGLLSVIDSSKLLAEGKPNDEAIENAAKAIVRNHGTVTPDPDLGSKDGGKPKPDMNEILRAAAQGVRL